MTLQGILHHSSYPYTPQQNGVAKWKNRHLIETTPSNPCPIAILGRCSTYCLLLNQSHAFFCATKSGFTFNLVSSTGTLFSSYMFFSRSHSRQKQVSSLIPQMYFLGLLLVTKKLLVLFSRSHCYVISTNVTFF